jgi:uncharacterized protein involved in cysteine biosynthesis
MEALLLAVSQLNDRVFLGVVWRSLVLSLLAFLALLAGSGWLLHAWVGQGGWLGWLAGIAGGFAVLLLAVWLFVPAALVIATFYCDRIAAAVEWRFYPGLPRPCGAPLLEQSWDGVVLGLQVLALQIGTLIASILIPGIGTVLGWVVTGWAIGRGLFVAVAMRRMSRPEALRVYARLRWQAFVPGVALAVASTFPPLNLLTPVVSIAAMVHVLQRR